MKKCKLNHFVLWCKGWYVSSKNVDIIAQAQKILQLDDYLPCNNPITIALIYIDELVDKGIIPPIRLQIWNDEIIQNIQYYNFDYNKALLYHIKNYLRFNITSEIFNLTPPIYSRKLYKMGFIAPKFMGNSYKLANNKANKIWKNYKRRTCKN